MKQLHQKIEARKDEIELKKQHLGQDYRSAKRRLTSSRMKLSTIGGLVLGFLLLPKKFKLIKGALKAYTMAATVKQMLDLIPHSSTTKRSRSKSKNTTHH
ncbi:MAG: hypothetical protein H0U71_06695 [Gammaproteobacteria bacterium]|nr:hypothetical protein [Gammaproteobacteria bacterium]